MQRFTHKLFALGVYLALACTLGCTQPPSMSSALWPFTGKTERPGIKTPAQRIAELKELAKSPSSSPADQQRVSSELAQQIQQEQDPLVRMQIIRTLAAYPTPTAAAMMQAALNDSDPDVRTVACQAWGRRGGPEAVAELSRVLASDTNVDVRLAAARGLGQTRDPQAVGPLSDVLADADPAIQRRAMESLKNVSGRDFGNDVGAWRQFAKGGPVNVQPPTLAERLRRLF